MINERILLKKIENIEIEEEIYLGDFKHYYLEDVKFTQEPIRANDCENLNGKYSWVAHCNREYSHRIVFPMRNTNYVAFFKTLKGAKRNFIKGYIKKR